ncbi:unnamed protein product [Didymodactylos carnosus]|uniref:G-protein coupled receptors family 1 profile domain-containing protein n=1 Tax=Didymodactylos carnosus TaxID=1234261 RepID=A0A813Z0U2_9BILA|nr:unnamed protein product [Didymodactylos carnosus]CAF3676666.1 unnamed protein product [Didymodactylos carnosus]
MSYERFILWANKIFPVIILPLATIGNILCFFVFFRQKFQHRLTRTSSTLLRLLCINDLLVLYLFTIDLLLKTYTVKTRHPLRIYFSPFTCRLYKFVRYSLFDLTAYLQVALTTDRFICCVHRSYYSHWRRHNYVYRLLLFALAAILIKNSSFLTILYGYYRGQALNSTMKRMKYNQTLANVRCSPHLDSQFFQVYMAYGQSIIDIIFVTFLPFFLILFLNYKILREVQRSRQRCFSITRALHLSTSPPPLTPNGIRLLAKSRQQRLNLTLTLVSISMVFILSTAPYKIFKVFERHDKLKRDLKSDVYQSEPKRPKLQMTEVFIDFLEFVSCSTPFFVCFCTSSMFRDELRKMFA